MVVDAVVDHEAGFVYYLAFDLLLAGAPIRDGAVYLQEASTTSADPDDPATAARHAALRAALLTRLGPAMAPDRDAEIDHANTFAQRAGLDAPTIPHDQVRRLRLDRDRPTPID